MPKVNVSFLLAALVLGAVVLWAAPLISSKTKRLVQGHVQTLAGVLLALLAVAFLSALVRGRGRQWLRSKLLGR